MFIAVVEAILKVQIPEIHRDPTTIEGQPARVCTHVHTRIGWQLLSTALSV
jgi:hypothetical protein